MNGMFSFGSVNEIALLKHVRNGLKTDFGNVDPTIVPKGIFAMRLRTRILYPSNFIFIKALNP